ncbi:hypothetical protein GCM10009589_21430 [Arthrobacter pascens]
MTIGATEGNIMAASITTHVTTKKPNGPGSVQRPMSIPLICAELKTQLAAASPSRMAIRPASRASTLDEDARGRDAAPEDPDGAAAETAARTWPCAPPPVNSFLRGMGKPDQALPLGASSAISLAKVKSEVSP